MVKQGLNVINSLHLSMKIEITKQSLNVSENTEKKVSH